MPRSPLTETIKRVQGMILYVQENLSGDEYMLFLDMVDPQPEPEAPAKRTRKKRGPSKKAQSLSNAISRDAKAENATLVLDGTPCVYQYPKDGEIKPGMICGCPADDTIHDSSMGYAGYHEFEAPKSKKAAK
jgi:hypothetical protein